MPSAANAFCTRSYSPTEAPPVVTRISASRSRARRTAAIVSVKRSPTTPRSLTVGAFLAHQRRERKAIGIDDLSRSRLDAWRHELVAGGEQRDLGAAMDRHQRMVHRRRRVARSRAVSRWPGSEERIAGAKIETRGADIAALGGWLLHLDRIVVAFASVPGSRRYRRRPARRRR